MIVQALNTNQLFANALEFYENASETRLSPDSSSFGVFSESVSVKFKKTGRTKIPKIFCTALHP